MGRGGLGWMGKWEERGGMGRQALGVDSRRSIWTDLGYGNVSEKKYRVGAIQRDRATM